jgi:hypothetical protein
MLVEPGADVDENVDDWQLLYGSVQQDLTRRDEKVACHELYSRTIQSTCKIVIGCLPYDQKHSTLRPYPMPRL